MAAGGVMTLVGSFVPWVRTGARTRNSYDVFRVMSRLGFAPDGATATAMQWWPLVPLLAVASIVAVWWGWGRAGGVGGLAAAVYAGAVGLTVANADAPGLVELGAGPWVTTVGALVLLVGSVSALVVGAGGTRVVTSATDRGASARP